MSTVSSLQRLLAGEHAAVHVYGHLGAHTSRSAVPELYDLVSDLYAGHRRSRDDLQQLLRERGATPAPAAAAYDVPADLSTPRAVRRAATAMEDKCAVLRADVVANTAGPERAWALAALRDGASARVLLGGSPQDFPGAPELGR